MSVNIIYPGSTVRIKATFKDAAGMTINPSTIILKIQSPDGAITSYTGLDLDNQSVGLWSMYYVPQTAGRYTIQWLTDSPDVVGQGYFDVRALAF